MIGDCLAVLYFFFFQAEDGIRDYKVTGVQTCALPISSYLALVSDQGLRTTVIVGRPDLGMPDWRGYVRGQPLSPEHVADVTAWLVAQRRPVPGRLPTITDTPRPAR